MNGLTAERQAIAAELTAAGVPATVDPGQVLNLITQAQVCALVEPADVQTGMGLSTLELRVDVRILTYGPYDHAAVERVDEALLLALPVLRPRDPVVWAEFDAADTPLPGRVVVTHRRIPYPLTVHP